MSVNRSLGEGCSGAARRKALLCEARKGTEVVRRSTASPTEHGATLKLSLECQRSWARRQDAFAAESQC